MLRHLAAPIAALALSLGAATSPLAQGFDTRATAAYVIDQTTGTVLLSKNADEPLPPASMSKLMTVYMAFDAIATGRLSVDEELPVSQHCFEYTGSTMFLNVNDRVRVEDLLRGIIVLSGNDASCVIAEGLAGTETAFANQMTVKARDLGMMNSTFANSNGWPAVGHRMSMRDIGILSDRLITDFPTFYPLFAEQQFDYDGEHPANVRNRNPLLGLGIGADGLKTGHTQEAGYGLAGSAKQGDRRVIFVITGLDSAQARAEESQRIVNWAFRQFAQRDLGTSGTQIAEADVWMGEQMTVGLTLAEDLSLLVPNTGSTEIDAEAVFNAPIEAPIAAGDELGELVIRLENLPETRVPLIAAADVARGGFNTRLRTTAEILAARIMADDAPQAQAAAE
ncbi:D-alanyl-D-alanine carboxypeptidase family protein [Pseudooctadecabacter jejudonensis]|uniref:serine-type D-Ala-D-Ala carboxypeptidase n=1 Tax=Pseudooctadecabacter jejudonensis TaxID=1391910 RepID=A0A1Y5SE09_9RHOB|nr:D-alanyl-D-alanine carboxypeptidase family protein [Pseudooctadecabacter jejudonensis]SLN38590.1 D-alanyl-D-alanine carboxypeptidase DacF precursor [Pseudooctadecabacter jejudonensis]